MFARSSDSFGDVYVTGFTYGDLDGINNAGERGDIFVLKYNSSGVKQ